MISANKAKEIAKEANAYYNSPEYPWDVLNEEIQKTSKNGKNYLTYSTNTFPAFHENRKEVRRKLEELGYQVEYRRFSEGDRDYQYTYNVYYIKW